MLLQKLSHEELREFACHYGNEIGKRQRRAGKHYTDVVDRLKSENKLVNVQGYYQGVTSIDNDLHYIIFSITLVIHMRVRK